MAKKTLEEKIKDVVFYATAFFIMYLVVGLLIKTEYLHCELTWDKLYDLFRDSLTLTAYFLAPVAAFVLFSDWRVEFRSRNNREKSIEIYNLSRELVLTLITTNWENPKATQSLYKQLMNLENLIFLLSNEPNNQEFRKYKENIKKMEDHLNNCISAYDSLEISILNRINGHHEFNASMQDEADLKHKFNMSLKEAYDLLAKIRPISI